MQRGCIRQSIRPPTRRVNCREYKAVFQKGMKRRKRSGSCQVLSRRLKSERQTLSCPLNTTTQTMRFRQAAIESSSKNDVTKKPTLPRRPPPCLPPDRSSAANLSRCVASVSAALKPLRGTASAHPPVFCALRRKESPMPSRVSQPTAVRNSPTARTIPKPIALHALRKRFPSPVSCTNASDPIAAPQRQGGTQPPQRRRGLPRVSRVLFLRRLLFSART